MQPEAFHDKRAGRVIKMTSGYSTFIPAPLSFDFELDNQTALLLSEADACLGELSGLGRHIPNPELLISPYSHREAVLSSRIEGTQASLSDLWLDQLGSDEHAENRDDVREVRNYIRAMRSSIQQIKQLPLASRLVKDIHRELMQGAPGKDKTPGEFRTSQNWIGPAGSNPVSAPYVPPPPGDEMLNSLADWERFVNERGKIPDLIQCALMHERFEAIHPFLDGNGRVGRLLITLFLMERTRLSTPLLYLSVFIEKHRQEYYDLLQRVRTHYARHEWVRFFLTGVAETSRQAVRQADLLLELRANWRKRLSGKHRARGLLDALFVNPYVTVASASRILKVTQPTATKTIKSLEQIGMLRELTGRQWGRVYVAEEILKAIETLPES